MSASTTNTLPPVELLVLKTLQDHHCDTRDQVINEATRTDPTVPKKAIGLAFDRLYRRRLIKWEGHGQPGKSHGHYRPV